MLISTLSPDIPFPPQIIVVSMIKNNEYKRTPRTLYNVRRYFPGNTNNESMKIDSSGTIIWSPGEGIEGIVNFSFSVRDGEYFYDDNNNSQFDDGEVYIDANNNSLFDYGIQSFSNFSITFFE